MEIITDFEDLGNNIKLTIEKTFKEDTRVRQLVIPKDILLKIVKSSMEGD